MLWRALAHVDHGSYIDVGAQDPIVDSVSLAFHERGWRGIHVEPTPHYAELLRRQRPGDTVIQAAVWNRPGVLRFFEIPGTGISTGDADIAGQHRERGFDPRESLVPCVTLAEIFDASAWSEIHWLKIDVEGLELEVLSSWGASTARPWIVVVESTLPMTQTETHEGWEATLVSLGYIPVYFDGLNRYYVSEAHPEIKGAFRSPPNVFDGFALNGTASAPFHKLIEQRCEEKVGGALAEVERHRRLANTEIESLNLSVASLQKTHAELGQSWIARERELVAQLLAIQHQASQEKTEQAQIHLNLERELHRQHVDRENVLNARLQTERDEVRYVQQDRAKRERALSEQIQQVRERLENILRVLAQREQEVAERLLAIQMQAAQEKEELVVTQMDQARELRDQHAAREQMLKSRLEAGQRELRRLEQDCARREKANAEQTDQSRQALENLLREQIKREQAISAQLLRIQQQALRESAELARSHGERERALERKHAEREREWARHERALDKEIADLQGETQALQYTQQLEAQRHHAELSARLDEHHRLIEACAAGEARLKAEMLAEQQNSVQLRQTLAHVQNSLATTQASLTWRMTAPLRRLAGLNAVRKKPAFGSNSSPPSSCDSATVAIESQSLFVQQATTKCSIPVALDPAAKEVRASDAEARIEIHAIPTSISESPAINGRNAFIESIMLFSTQTSVPSFAGAASTLSELLALHDRQFVLCAYQTLLGRSPDPEGLSYYVGRLRAGNSKIGLLKQLRLSSEGQAHAAKLPGLDAAIRRQKKGQIPLVGRLFRLLGGVESNHPTQRKLRVIENQLFALSHQSDCRFNQMEAALTGLHQLVIEQSQAVIADPCRPPPAIPDTAVSVAVVHPSESDNLKRLSPRARSVYFQLKATTAGHAGRAA
ncbi:FkbM family methyltransferase [Paraburkholderia sp. MM6662-R1]|uniref:FkbM family methyltransferase n=1 Tax=Paraburkholderia sp. MM6662-R1 TaxID=2991066 RepID=UPI003D215D60